MIIIKILVLTTSGFAPTHTPKLLAQIDYLNLFSDMDIIVKQDASLGDIEHSIMTERFDCIYPTTVFEYSEDKKSIVSFNKKLYQILEYHHQAYIGSELFVHMLLNDKALTNIRCKMSLPSKLLTRTLWEKRYGDAVSYIETAPFPIIVKPNTLAASLGISKSSIAYSAKEAVDIIEKQFDTFPNVSELLLEHYLCTAQEFTVSVTGNGKKAFCSTTALISQTEEYEMFSYLNKNLETDKRFIKYTSNIADELREFLKEQALYLSHLLGVRDYSRFDFLMDHDNKLYLIDANSLPALSSNYLLEYVDKQLLQENQILSLILTVFCKRMNLLYPQCSAHISNDILMHLI